ncbi:MAG: hypothetical protein R3F39_20360 [Myxococcota bacterium]
MQKSVTRLGRLVSGEGAPVVCAADGTPHTLSAAAAAVWFAADGQRDAAALQVELAKVEPGAGRERVFALLDQLSEAGLVEGRLAPPTDGVDRRGLFQRFAFGAAAAAVVAPVLARAGTARAAAAEVCQDDVAFRHGEMAAKTEVKGHLKELAGESKEKQQLDEEAARLKLKLEQAVKAGKDSTESQTKFKKEQDAKQTSYQQESALKAKKLQPGGDSVRESKMKATSAQRRFGVGPSAVFVDLPSGEVFEGLVELSDIVMDGDEKLCTLTLIIESGSTLSVEGGNIQLLDRAFREGQKSGATFGLQWGTEGEFAAVGTVLESVTENVGFDPATGKPTHQRAQVRLGVGDETYSVGADGGGF